MLNTWSIVAFNHIALSPLCLSSNQRKHQAMYDDFVKRKDMKREGYSSGTLNSFTTNGGTSRYTLPIIAGGGAGAMRTLEGAVGGRFGGGVTKFEKHDPRQVCFTPSPLQMQIAALQFMQFGNKLHHLLRYCNEIIFYNESNTVFCHHRFWSQRL